MKKQKKLILFIAFGVAAVLMMLIMEYRSLHNQVQRLHAIQEQYYGYIARVQQVLLAQRSQNSTHPLHLFAAIDRTTSYLKQSTQSDLQTQQREELLQRVENVEDEYTEQTIRDAEASVVEAQADTQDADAEMDALIAQWARKVRRTPETDVTFICPIERSRFWFSSLFGSRKKPNGDLGFHTGIDMAAQRGTDVCAAAAGTVEFAGSAPGYGNTIVIVHDAVYKTRYAHLDTTFVEKAQVVAQGDRIGAVGDTGFTIKQGTDASHLHFELYERGKQINPLAFVSF